MVEKNTALPQSNQINVSKSRWPLVSIVILAVICGFVLFLVGYDQGHLFSLMIGEQAFEDLYLHELTHDMRHAAGFPCH